MRDIVWTIILIWLAWQFVNIFRSLRATKQTSEIRDQPAPGRRDLHSVRRKQLDSEGEYVDFEEIR